MKSTSNIKLSEIQYSLPFVLDMMNDCSKNRDNKTVRDFFALCGLSLIPKDKKKRQKDRTYLTIEFITRIWPYKDPETGALLELKKNKETEQMELVPVKRFTGPKVLDVLEKYALEKKKRLCNS